VQLRQAKTVGAMDQNGVRCWHIDTGLDDGRAQQEVKALRMKVTHDRLQFALRHLPVAHHHARLRHQLAQFYSAVLDGFDFVMQKVHLTAPAQFAQYRLADRTIAFLANEGLDRQAALGGSGNHREIPQPLHAHRKRAWNRGGGERQHVHLGAQVLEHLLLAYAEAMFLVNDHQAEPGKLHIGREQFVGANHNVDLAFGDSIERLTHLFCTSEA